MAVKSYDQAVFLECLIPQTDFCKRPTNTLSFAKTSSDSKMPRRMRRKFSSRTWRSAFEFAWRQIFAPLRGGMAAFAP
jgi:hypothetical protein